MKLQKLLTNLITLTLLFAFSQIKAITTFDPTTHAHLIENINVLEEQIKTLDDQLGILKESQTIFSEMEKTLGTIKGTRNVGQKYLNNLNATQNYFDNALTGLPSDIARKYRAGGYSNSDLWESFENSLEQDYNFYSQTANPYQYKQHIDGINHENVKQAIVNAQVQFEKTGKDFDNLKEQADKVGKTEDLKGATALTNSLLVGITQQLIELKQLFATFINARMQLLYQEHQLQNASVDATETNQLDKEAKSIGAELKEAIEKLPESYDNFGKKADEVQNEACQIAKKYGYKKYGC